MIEALRELADQLETGCGMNHCRINPPDGMAPNGGCRCDKRRFAQTLKGFADDVLELELKESDQPNKPKPSREI